jgi:choline kinase
MQTVVHAPGEGTHLRPLTEEKPKALVDLSFETERTIDIHGDTAAKDTETASTVE